VTAVSSSQFVEGAISGVETPSAGPKKLHAPPHVGFTIEREFHFAGADIRTLATLIGDDNELHHDAAQATGFAFKDVIVAGGHTTSVMMGAISTGLMEFWPNIGLGYSSRFRRAILAGETVKIHWQVVSCEHTAKLRGMVVKFEGSLINSTGETAVIASCDTLIPDGGYLAD